MPTDGGLAKKNAVGSRERRGGKRTKLGTDGMIFWGRQEQESSGGIAGLLSQPNSKGCTMVV